MKLKKDNALAGIDMIIAIVVIIIFSVLILTLITNNSLENVKNAKETMAMIYITEIFENIGIEKYEDITEEKITNFIPQEALNNYQIEVNIENNFADISEGEEILKKVKIKLIYEIANKTYECSMERLKIKE